MTYGLGIDVGTTFSAAAVSRPDGNIELINLGGRAASMPSVVVAREDGLLLFGEAGESRARVDPTRVAREFKRRLGDPTPLVLGGTPYSAQSLTSLLIRHIFGEVVTRMNSKPAVVVITHPASYSSYRRDALATAIAEAGVDDAVLISEPEAAATEYAARSSVEIGDVIAVYDFGGGTFDVALLRRTTEGFLLLGSPIGVENLGGSDFDVAVFEHVNDMTGGLLDDLDVTVPGNLAVLNRLRRDCRDAKESLSSDIDAAIPVTVAGANTSVTLTRKEFQRLIYPRVPETFAALRRALDGAGVELGQVNRIVLVGGSSRIPLIRERVVAETGRPIASDVDPEHAVVLGAARVAHRLEHLVEMPLTQHGNVADRSWLPPATTEVIAQTSKLPVAPAAEIPAAEVIAPARSPLNPPFSPVPMVSSARARADLTTGSESSSMAGLGPRRRRTPDKVWGVVFLVAGSILTLLSSAKTAFDSDNFTFTTDFGRDTFVSNVTFVVLMCIPLLGLLSPRHSGGFVLGTAIGIGIGVLFEVLEVLGSSATKLGGVSVSPVWLALVISGVGAWLVAARRLSWADRTAGPVGHATASEPTARAAVTVLAFLGSVGVLGFASLHHLIVLESRLDGVRQIADENRWIFYFVCSGLAAVLLVSGAFKYRRLQWAASGLCAAEAAYVLQFTELFFKDGSHAKILASSALVIALLLATYPLSSFIGRRPVRPSSDGR